MGEGEAETPTNLPGYKSSHSNVWMLNVFNSVKPYGSRVKVIPGQLFNESSQFYRDFCRSSQKSDNEAHEGACTLS